MILNAQLDGVLYQPIKCIRCYDSDMIGIVLSNRIGIDQLAVGYI